jgi:hypothetical protein
MFAPGGIAIISLELMSLDERRYNRGESVDGICGANDVLLLDTYRGYT